MLELIIPIGFSGSGKTTYYHRRFNQNNSIYLSKDNLRIQYCGDINDQSRNKFIAIRSAKILTDTIEQNLNSDLKIYYDNINLNMLYTIKKYLHDYPTLRIKVIFFMDSKNPTLRVQRIQQDIQNNVVRANTIDYVKENGDNEIVLFEKEMNKIIKYYYLLTDDNLINRLTISRFQNNKTFNLNHH